MKPTISVDRQLLTYRDGAHELRLSVEWSAVPRTDDCPIDFEISAGDLETWTEPAGQRIDPATRDRLLDEIAAYYSKAPAADLIGRNGELLRGVSKFRFSLQIPPSPSFYYELGRFLAIPMAPPNGALEWDKKYVADFSGITQWTSPRLPLDNAHLRLIADRIVRQQRIGIIGIPRP